MNKGKGSTRGLVRDTGSLGFRLYVSLNRTVPFLTYHKKSHDTKKFLVSSQSVFSSSVVRGHSWKGRTYTCPPVLWKNKQVEVTHGMSLRDLVLRLGLTVSVTPILRRNFTL